MDDRNGYMLGKRLGRRGYDWWWHSLVATNRASGQKQAFFIEYFLINPALGGERAVLGQDPANRAAGIKPSYGMIKAGTWVDGGAVQVHEFFPIAACLARPDAMDVRIGPNLATDRVLKGQVSQSSERVAAHPELMSQAGEMSWDLSLDKRISWSVGYGGSRLFRWLDAFQMYWHVAGMRTDYRGTISWNGQVFDVEPGSSAGYQDKNWGRDFTSPWVWLNCNSLRDDRTGEALLGSSLDVGGGRPVVFGLPLPQRLLIAFCHEGAWHEWNFSRFWRWSKQRFVCTVGETAIRWQIEAWDRRERIEIDFSCPKSSMLLVNYENPRGEKNHRQLWNGGNAHGTLKLYRRERKGWLEEGSFTGDFGGCEYGESSAPD